MMLKLFFGLLSMYLLVGQSLINDGVLIGEVGIYEGNCMPSPGAPPCEPRPLSALIYVTQPSEKYDQELVIDSVWSDETGQFGLELAAGSYSIFIKDGSQITCTVTSCPSKCYCLPVKVVADSSTRVEVVLDHATW